MNRIRFLRLQSGMKQAELAEKILVSQSSLSGYESGKFEPDSKTLLKIANVFQVSVDYLLGGDNLSSQEKSLVKIPVYQHLPDSTQKQTPILFYYQEIDPYKSQSGTYFGLYMHADFMEPRICAGDLIIARRQSEVPNGSVAVIQTGKSEAVVKKVWRLADGEIMLMSINAKYEPVFYTSTQTASLPVRVLGLVVEFHGKMKLG